MLGTACRVSLPHPPLPYHIPEDRVHICAVLSTTELSSCTFTISHPRKQLCWYSPVLSGYLWHTKHCPTQCSTDACSTQECKCRCFFSPSILLGLSPTATYVGQGLNLYCPKIHSHTLMHVTTERLLTVQRDWYWRIHMYKHTAECETTCIWKLSPTSYCLNSDAKNTQDTCVMANQKVSCSRTSTKHRTWNPYDKTQRLNTTTTNMDRTVREAQLHAENFNREAGFLLSCTWQPVISLLKCSPQARKDGPGLVQRPFHSSH